MCFDQKDNHFHTITNRHSTRMKQGTKYKTIIRSCVKTESKASVMDGVSLLEAIQPRMECVYIHQDTLWSVCHSNTPLKMSRLSASFIFPLYTRREHFWFQCGGTAVSVKAWVITVKMIVGTTTTEN